MAMEIDTTDARTGHFLLQQNVKASATADEAILKLQNTL
jgi:hypothetical protein